ncbi:unnamed protein product [Meloidogyne enterolobii]|uniref:Uncharacterized protein n=1 Tax=Meloidogyne enterolobii TaxID=390850 RepID=A0ACB0Z5H1_MELEN
MSSNSNSNRKRKKSPVPPNQGSKTSAVATQNNLQQQLIVQRVQTTSNQTNVAGGQQNQQIIQTTNSAERQILEQEIAEKRRNRAITQPENLHLLNLIDPATNLTNTDVLMLRWQKKLFLELKGVVVFVKRAPTSKNGWDRGDLIVQLGQEHEKERVAVFGWNEYAGILATANLNDVVVMRNLIVVPEDSVRVKWSGSIEFKLKFVKGSTMNIEGRGQINVNQDAVIGRGN